MTGGGFVGQMHQTNNQNRDWLKSVTRKAYEFPPYNKSERRGPVRVHTAELGEDEKKFIRRMVAGQKAADFANVFIVLITAVVITAILFFIFYAEVIPALMD